MSSSGTMREAPALTLPALLAGASIGLVVGAAALGVATAAGSPSLALANAGGFLLAGALVLYPIGVAVGLPMLRFFRRRFSDTRSIGAAIACVGIGAGVVLTVIIGLLTKQFWNTALAVLPATIWFVGTGLLGGYGLSKRPRAVTTILTLVGGSAVAAAVYFLLRSVLLA